MVVPGGRQTRSGMNDCAAMTTPRTRAGAVAHAERVLFEGVLAPRPGPPEELEVELAPLLEQGAGPGAGRLLLLRRRDRVPGDQHQCDEKAACARHEPTYFASAASISCTRAPRSRFSMP